MTDWIISKAHTADLPEIARLANSAYRGEGAKVGWTHEADLLDGQRTDPLALAEELAGPHPSVVLCLREKQSGPILGCVFLEKVTEDEDEPARCYLGMLTVAPGLQARGLGRILLQGAEDFAREWGAASMEMTVISVRHELIAWYERRGFRRTGDTKPFPYDDERFGVPRQMDLNFVVLDKDLSGPPPARGREGPAPHGHIAWSELNTRDAEAAKRFLAATLGWSFEAKPMAEGGTYWLARSGGAIVAGIFTMAGPQFFGVPEHWFTYVEIDDVDRRVAGVAAAGGTVMRAPWSVPGTGRIAIVRAPGGGVMGWMTSVRPA